MARGGAGAGLSDATGGAFFGRGPVALGTSDDL